MNTAMNHLFAVYRQNIATGDGNHFVARPQKHWRKQYQSLLGYSRASVGMPMDRPGGIMPVANNTIACQTCRGALSAKVIVGKDSPCTSCQPIKARVKPRYTAFTDNKAYLQSRCVTYDQKLSIEQVEGINYFSPNGVPLEPSSSPTGPQVREVADCYNNKPPLVCNTTIYKPNNVQFSQQGGVSSSSRIARLKYNTLNNIPVNNNGITVNGSVFNTAAGAMGLNSGLYLMEPSPSYYIKSKPQPAVCSRRNGVKAYC
jgi:hypothetical protein